MVYKDIKNDAQEFKNELIILKFIKYIINTDIENIDLNTAHIVL